MKVYRYKKGSELQLEEPTSFALGFFDGVHTAHRELIEKTRKEASRLSLPLGIFTFSSSEIKAGVKRIYTEEEKLFLFEKMGADIVFIADFDAVKELSPSEFVEDFLKKRLSAALVAAGYNFKFGRYASADVRVLKELAQKNGIPSVICEEYDDGGMPVSSSRIRKCLTEGNMKEASKLLGHPYFILATVEGGLGLGHSLGFPTINASFDKEKLVVRFGVYESRVKLSGKYYPALTNVGTCPTFGERKAHTETFILNFSGNLYGERLEIQLLDYLREEKKFESSKELTMQINIDKSKVFERNK